MLSATGSKTERRAVEGLDSDYLPDLRVRSFGRIMVHQRTVLQCVGSVTMTAGAKL